MNLIAKKSVPLSSVFEDIFKPDWFGGFQDVQNLQKNVPAVNIIQNEDSFEIDVAVPGLRKEDVTIEIDNDFLIISSQQKSENSQTNLNGDYTRREFNYSSFTRSFSLPETVDEQKINAIHENGILKITLPKKEEALPKPKRLIEIS